MWKRGFNKKRNLICEIAFANWSNFGVIILFCASRNKDSGFKEKRCIKTDETIVYWFSFFREVCANYFIVKKQYLGGVNCVVELDEAMLVRRKYNRKGGAWTVGFRYVWSSTKNRCCYTSRESFSTDLYPNFSWLCQTCSVIYTDSAPVYNCLSQLGFVHL